MTLSEDLRWMLCNSVRTYFAPITGAIKGIRAELRRVERDARRQRALQERQEQKPTRIV